MRFDAMKFLEALFAPDAPNVTTREPRPTGRTRAEPLAVPTEAMAMPSDSPAGWRERLTDAERDLFPLDMEPPADHVRDVLTARELFDGEIVAAHLPAKPNLPEPAKGPPPEPEPGIRPDDFSPDWREAFEERAAIMEYDAHMTRADAEKFALADVRRRMRAGGA